MDEVADTDLEATAMVLAWNCFYGSQGLAAAQEWLARGGPELCRSLGAYEARLLSLGGPPTWPAHCSPHSAAEALAALGVQPATAEAWAQASAR